MSRSTKTTTFSVQETEWNKKQRDIFCGKPKESLILCYLTKQILVYSQTVQTFSEVILVQSGSFFSSVTQFSGTHGAAAVNVCTNL